MSLIVQQDGASHLLVDKTKVLILVVFGRIFQGSLPYSLVSIVSLDFNCVCRIFQGFLPVSLVFIVTL